jgi:DNA-binding beta-propeller fold protein YncE
MPLMFDGEFLEMRTIICIMMLSCPSFSQTAITFMGAIKNGGNGVQGINKATSVAVSPDNKNVYVTGDSTLAVFNRDPATGALTFAMSFVNGKDSVHGLNGARSLIVSPNNKNVYLASTIDVTVVGFSRDTASGALTFLPLVWQLDQGRVGVPVSIAITPDNKHVYGAGFIDSTIFVFSRDTIEGVLFRKGQIGNGEWSECLNGFRMRVGAGPDNENVYVADYNNSPSIAVFRRHQATGSLIPRPNACLRVAALDNKGTTSQVVVSQDNKSVYVAKENGIAAFHRNISSGELTYYTCFTEVSGHTAVAVSPDNKTVYAVGGANLAVFSRDTLSGALAGIKIIKDGSDSVDGLRGCRSVAASPDNKNVYVAGTDDNAVALFSVAQPVKTAPESCVPPQRMQRLSARCSGGTWVIGLSLRIAGVIDLSVFDARGKLLRNLIHGSVPAGRHAVTTDIASFQSGACFLRLVSDGGRRTVKAIVVK